MYSREGIAKFIHKCQRTFCSYDMFGLRLGDMSPISQEEANKRKPPSMCDCKYGATNIGGPTETGNGCPEMRCVHAIFENMTDKEFERIMKRMDKRVKKGWKKYNKAQKKNVQKVR